MDHKRAKRTFPELLKSKHCLCPYIQLPTATATQHKPLTIQQYLQAYSCCLLWLVDWCCPKQDQPLYIPARISDTSWTNNTEIRQTVTLSFEMQKMW